MTSNLFQSPELETIKTTQLLKLVVFSIGRLNVSIPIQSVKKIINRTTVYGSGLNHIGVAHIGDREMAVVDLHKRLFNESQMTESGTTGYIVLAKRSSGEQFGILAIETPTLIDVPLSLVRVLPESYRRADTLEIASHVAVISTPTEMTIFVLDVEQLLPKVARK